jgi:hypothetical protein
MNFTGNHNEKRVKATRCHFYSVQPDGLWAKGPLYFRQLIKPRRLRPRAFSRNRNPPRLRKTIVGLVMGLQVNY